MDPGTLLISGCDRGLGLALARFFGEKGWTVFCGCLGEEGLETCAGLEGAVHPLPLDVDDQGSVDGAVAAVSSCCDSLSLLINNAGILGNVNDPIDGALDLDQMERVYRVNALGPLRLTKAFLPLLLASGSPRVVNISSEAGSNGACRRDSWFGYAMSKAALNRQSVLLHHWLHGRGGGVLVLHPGWIRSYMYGKKDLEAELEPEEAALMVYRNIAQPRAFGGPEPLYLDHEGRALPW